MYFNILKRDIRRKKTMNIILLLFTIMATMFVASGLNNVITVMNGTEYFFDKAGMGDYMVITQSGDGGVTDILEASTHVSDYRADQCIWANKDNLLVAGKKAEMKNNAVLVQSLNEEGINLFLSDNSVLREVKDGEVYVTAGFLAKNHCKQGDELKISFEKIELRLTIAGEIKDALLGSEMMGNTRLIVSEADYKELTQEKSLEPFAGMIFYIDCDDVNALGEELTRASHILFDNDRDTIKLTYVMDMIVAMIVLVLSVCLIIVSFVILKFVISFTIQEEFREIGVMKAIGIRNRKIRTLYIVKYLVMALAGGSMGLLLSIPFGSMMIKTVSVKMVLGNDKGYLFNVIGTLFTIGLMVGFAWLCTGRIRRCTPLDAIRSGQTGERFRKKGLYHLSRTRAGSTFYLAMNDVLSAPVRFLTIIISFFLCSIFVLGVQLCADTMNSKNLITTFGKESDVYITDAKMVNFNFMTEEGDQKLQEQYREMEETLAAEGMPCNVSLENWYKYSCEFEGNTFTLTFQQNTKLRADEYTYTKGTPPQNADEIAITPQISKKLGAKIGDTLTVDFGGEKRDCMIVAYYQTMNQLGEVIRLHEAAPTSMKYCCSMMAFQIDFTDAPDEAEIDRRIGRIKELYEIEDVMDAAEYCADCIGVTGTMEMVSRFLMIVTCVVVILVTILMERSFISDETGQIALLKAIGFKDRAIIAWHCCRFMIVAVASELLAAALTIPVTKLWCDPIWDMMGASKVTYYFNPWKLLLLYPGMLLAITLFTVWCTALYTKRIHSRDIVNIE